MLVKGDDHAARHTRIGAEVNVIGQFLEWERRAVRPSTMSERLAPYLRYFSSHRPTDDHGVQPYALVVFEDDLVQTHFLRLAREEMQAARVQVPGSPMVRPLTPWGYWGAHGGHPVTGIRPRPCRPNERRP